MPSEFPVALGAALADAYGDPSLIKKRAVAVLKALGPLSAEGGALVSLIVAAYLARVHGANAEEFAKAASALFDTPPHFIGEPPAESINPRARGTT